MNAKPTLLYHPNSPFVRKVSIALFEQGLTDAVELRPVKISPLVKNPEVYAHNPIGQIPTLLLPDGTVVHDSRVIIEFLDSLHSREPLIPRSGPDRWRALTLASIGDALITTTINCLRESFMRPESLRWKDWIEILKDKINGALDHLESSWIEHLETRTDIGAVTVASALGFIEYRQERLCIANDRPRLAAWFKEFSTRESIQKTMPDEGKATV